MPRPLREQLSELSIPLALTTVAVVILFWLLHTMTPHPIAVYTRDFIVIFDAKFFVGFISQLGLFFWSATAACCLFAASLLRSKKIDPSIHQHLFFGGIFSTVLLLDDAFLFHDQIVPIYLHLPEPMMYVTYAVGAGAFVITFRRRIAETDYLFLGAALTCFAASIALDFEKILPGTHPLQFALEDGLKFIGILLWFQYFTRTGYRAVVQARS